jgi:hypothetical protein
MRDKGDYGYVREIGIGSNFDSVDHKGWWMEKKGQHDILLLYMSS